MNNTPTIRINLSLLLFCIVLITSISNAATPTIEVISFPPYGENGEISGRVSGVEPESHNVALYIFVEGGGWWTKPTFNDPLIPIQPDSSWDAQMTTGAGDRYATEIRVYVVPDSVLIPIAGGMACLLDSLEQISVAAVSIRREPPTIRFAGYDWYLKNSVGRIGPGPNYFRGAAENVWVDASGMLHLKITQQDGNWYCAEVVLTESLDYGNYLFEISSPVGRLNENIVFGIFTWDNDACDEAHREIDIEFSRWGEPGALNAQYVIQPWDWSGNRHRWQIPDSLANSAHVIQWLPDRLSFSSYRGHGQNADSLLNHWEYTAASVPRHGAETIRINLWLMSGEPPTDEREAEVIISNFRFEKAATKQRPPDLQPRKFQVWQNYPNPFNSGTRLNYRLAEAAMVRIRIYNIMGELVTTLVDGFQQSQEYSINWQAGDLPSGIYFGEIISGENRQIWKMTLLR